MLIKVRNFRGVKSADIELSRVTLIGGSNAAGKSSIAQAIGAALTGDAVPLAGLRKTDAGMLVHAGTGKGGVQVETDPDNWISVSYPSAKVKSEGMPPYASRYAVGLARLEELTPKEMSPVLIEYLKATPSREDVAAAMVKIGFSDEPTGDESPNTVERLWQNIGKLGWDGALAQAKEVGARLKEKWHAATGEHYGSAKAESWMPAKWASDLETASEDGLENALTEAREFHEAAVAATAISEDERQRLTDAAAQIPALEEEIAQGKAAVSAAAEELEAAHKKNRELPRPSAEERTTPCPHCAEPIVVRGSTLAKPTPVDAEENKARAAAIEAAQKVIDAAIAKHSAARHALANSEAALAGGVMARNKLRDMPAPVDNGDDVEAARTRVRDAEDRLKAFRAKHAADGAHRDITLNAQIQAMLATDGLRLRKLRDAVAAFNVELAALAKAAGWGAVEIGDDLLVSYDGKPLILLSDSEKFRCRAILQRALAIRDGSAAIVIDAADILDREGRNGLMSLVMGSGLPAIVLMTLPGREALPDLGDAGASYWLEGSTAERCHEEAA